MSPYLETEGSIGSQEMTATTQVETGAPSERQKPAFLLPLPSVPFRDSPLTHGWGWGPSATSKTAVVSFRWAFFRRAEQLSQMDQSAKTEISSPPKEETAEGSGSVGEHPCAQHAHGPGFDPQLRKVKMSRGDSPASWLFHEEH